MLLAQGDCRGALTRNTLFGIIVCVAQYSITGSKLDSNDD